MAENVEYFTSDGKPKKEKSGRSSVICHSGRRNYYFE